MDVSPRNEEIMTFESLEQQQRYNRPSADKPTMILYTQINRAPHTANFEDNSPTLHKNIKAVLRKTALTNQTAINLKEKRPRSSFVQKGVDNRRSFIYPKSIEHKKNCSRIQKQFIDAYKEKFIIDGKQTINDHPNAVNQILYTGLSASAIASFKWNSVAARRRLIETQPQCPELESYPLTPRAIEQIEQTEAKMARRRNQGIVHMSSDKQKLHRQQQKTILENQGNLEKFLTQIRGLDKNNQIIFGTKMDEYQDILEYCDATKNDYNQFNISQAENDIEFIKVSKIKFDKNPDEWVMKRRGSKEGTPQNFSRAKAESVHKLPKKRYEDPEDVYQVAPVNFLTASLNLGKPLTEQVDAPRARYLDHFKRKPRHLKEVNLSSVI